MIRARRASVRLDANDAVVEQEQRGLFGVLRLVDGELLDAVDQNGWIALRRHDRRLRGKGSDAGEKASNGRVKERLRHRHRGVPPGMRVENAR